MERGIARVWNLDSAIGGDEHEERGRMIHTNEIRLLETADVIHVSIFVYNVIYIYTCYSLLLSLFFSHPHSSARGMFTSK